MRLSAVIGIVSVVTYSTSAASARRCTAKSESTECTALAYTFAVLGSMAVQGPVMSWVADHRKHHAHTDEEGDPHSPHVGHGDGASGVFRGLWHAHTGWLFSTQGRASARRYAADWLIRDFGSPAQAGFGVAQGVMRIIMLPAMAVAFAAAPIAGHGLTWTRSFGSPRSRS